MEWVDLKSGKPQIIQGMHTYPAPNVSTQTTEMDLCSGSKDLKIPSLMFMIMLQGTFLHHGKPLGVPLDSVGEASPSAETMEERVTSFWEEARGRISLPTNNFGMHNSKETSSKNAITTIYATTTLSL